jgi:adenosylmethionine-8-amino-7-oxononanoate aminotransferase
MELQRAQVYPFVSPRGTTPLVIARTEGVHLITPDGRRILDAAGGAIVVNIGHGRREVADAYARAVTEATYVVPPFATEARVRLVERLQRAWLPEGITRAVFTSGGSEAMDAAIRLARQHHLSAGRPSRWKVIGRQLSYHGATLSTLAIGGNEKRRLGFEPWFPALPKAPACYCLRCPLGKTYPECATACASDLERIIAEEGAETIAAFVAEPIVGSTAGAVVPVDEYWPMVADICRRHGILLIADEVMTGFGRTGKRFGVEHWNVTPDVLVSGKGLTGGYAPMGGVYARETVIEPIAARGDELMFFTYGAHPAACAVADTVLDILEREHLVSRAAATGAQLKQRLVERLGDHPHVGDIRGRGLLLGIELVRDRATLEPFPKQANLTTKVVAAGIGLGTFFYPGGCDPARDVITLGPPFTIEPEHVEQIADHLEQAIASALDRVR